jgi:hypothetical protein
VYLFIGTFEMMVVYREDRTGHAKTLCGQSADILVLNLVVHMVASRLQTVETNCMAIN